MTSWAEEELKTVSLGDARLVKRVVVLTKELPQTRLVCVGNRESDMMALFEQTQRDDWAVDVLVRAQHDRVLPGKEAGKLCSTLMDAPVLERIRFDMPAGRGRKARTVPLPLR